MCYPLQKNPQAEEFSELTGQEINIMFIRAEAYGQYAIPDEYFEDDKKIYDYLKAKHILIGEVYDGRRKFIQKDLLGNDTTTVNFRYVTSNRMYVGEGEYFFRSVLVETDEYSERLTLFNSKDRRKIKHDIDDEEDESVFDKLFTYDDDDDGKMTFQPNVIFVDDLDDTVAIKSDIEEYLIEHDLVSGFDETTPVTCSEQNAFGVKFINPITFIIHFEQHV